MHPSKTLCVGSMPLNRPGIGAARLENVDIRDNKYVYRFLPRHMRSIINTDEICNRRGWGFEGVLLKTMDEGSWLVSNSSLHTASQPARHWICCPTVVELPKWLLLPCYASCRLASTVQIISRPPEQAGIATQSDLAGCFFRSSEFSFLPSSLLQHSLHPPGTRPLLLVHC